MFANMEKYQRMKGKAGPQNMIWNTGEKNEPHLV
jgi:hypothetical protein